jgi:hypothetical protein
MTGQSAPADPRGSAVLAPMHPMSLASAPAHTAWSCHIYGADRAVATDADGARPRGVGAVGRPAWVKWWRGRLAG